MARRPQQRSGETEKDRIVDAFMRLLAERSLGRISLAEIAGEASVSVGELRGAFAGKLQILEAFSQRIDQVVLDGGSGEGETARDRVFDVIMRRFDALASYKDAIRNVVLAARCDLCLAAFLDRSATRSMKWMLVAARSDRSGLLGAIAVKGLVLVSAEALRVWLDDDDPGLARTMAALDRGLDRGARTMDCVDRLCHRLRPFTRGERAGPERPAEA